MEQKFKKSDGGIDLRALREFCEREGKMVEYRKGEQLEREGDPARWFGFVAEGCFKYVTRGIKNMELRALVAEHMLNQFKARYQDFHRATPHERYDQLLSRCPGIVEHLPLNAIASFLNVTPQMLSRIRKDLLLHDGEKTAFGAQE